jgi:hypothetical protein
VELSGLSVGSASVYAKVYLDDGTYVRTNTEYINVKAVGNGTFDIKREYDLSYKTEGDGQVCVKDGHFELSTDNRTAEVPENTEIKIRMAQFSLKRIRLNKSNFIQALTDKLFWGEDLRNNR